MTTRCFAAPAAASSDPDNTVVTSRRLGASATATNGGASDDEAWRDPGALCAAFEHCDDAALAERVARALQTLTDALRIFGPDAVYASFNGGKDAVVILHLLRAAAWKARRDADNESRSSTALPHVVYFDTSDEFDEVRALVHDTSRALADAQEFRVETVEIDVGFVAGLRAIVQKTHPIPLAFVLGTRKGDPNCGDQERFEPSSSWMPPFIRVNPILDWTYGDVWAFLRHFNLPYCSLYDDGYTSLGSMQNTQRNPTLLQEDGSYLPAYELRDWSLERAGRVESPKRKGAPPKAN